MVATGPKILRQVQVNTSKYKKCKKYSNAGRESNHNNVNESKKKNRFRHTKVNLNGPRETPDA